MIVNQLSAKGNQFVAAVFNNNFLQIPDLFPDGELSHPIAYYAREALDKINGATANLELCLRSSWDRMDVTDNTVGSCRSGFSLSDLGKVLTQYVKIISKLFDIREIVRKSAYGVFSITQRKILDADLRYQLEEMAILRNTKVTGVTPLTQRFLKILISSQLLGIKNPVIVGRYEQEAINNSLNSLLAIERGFEAAGACIAVNAYRPER